MAFHVGLYKIAFDSSSPLWIQRASLKNQLLELWWNFVNEILYNQLLNVPNQMQVLRMTKQHEIVVMETVRTKSGNPQQQKKRKN